MTSRVSSWRSDRIEYICSAVGAFVTVSALRCVLSDRTMVMRAGHSRTFAVPWNGGQALHYMAACEQPMQPVYPLQLLLGGHFLHALEQHAFLEPDVCFQFLFDQ